MAYYSILNAGTPVSTLGLNSFIAVNTQDILLKLPAARRHGLGQPPLSARAIPVGPDHRGGSCWRRTSMISTTESAGSVKFQEKLPFLSIGRSGVLRSLRLGIGN